MIQTLDSIINEQYYTADFKWDGRYELGKPLQYNLIWPKPPRRETYQGLNSNNFLEGDCR